MLSAADEHAVLQFYGKSHADNPWLPLDKQDEVVMEVRAGQLIGRAARVLMRASTAREY